MHYSQLPIYKQNKFVCSYSWLYTLCMLCVSLYVWLVQGSVVILRSPQLTFIFYWWIHRGANTTIESTSKLLTVGQCSQYSIVYLQCIQILDPTINQYRGVEYTIPDRSRAMRISYNLQSKIFLCVQCTPYLL